MVFWSREATIQSKKTFTRCNNDNDIIPILRKLSSISNFFPFNTKYLSQKVDLSK